MVDDSTPFLARRRDFPAENGEKVTTTAGVSNRSRTCKNGYGNVARGLDAPNPRVVSKIGAKTVISCIQGSLGEDDATGA